MTNNARANEIRRAKRAGLPVPPRPIVYVQCTWCPATFARDRAKQVFCSPECMKQAGHVTRKYGLTYQQYQDLLLQGCGVCGATELLHVDHDHECCPGKNSCGKCIRGALCRRHNMALGAFEDNVQDLLKAVEYLTKNKH